MIIQKDMFNVQNQRYFPAAVNMINKNFYYRGQEKVSTVQEYYEKFKNNMDVMEKIDFPGADQRTVDCILSEIGQ